MEKSQKQDKRNIFLEWCQVTTCAGVIDCLLSRTFLGKSFWILFIVSGLGLTVWQTQKQIDDFIYGDFYETSTTIIAGNSMPFPNITICNFNRIDKNKAKSLSRIGLNYALSSAPIDFFSYSDNGLTNDLSKAEYEKMITENNITNIADLFHRYGHTCEGTLIACSWYLEAFDCCQAATELITMYGRCWNILPKLMSTRDERLKQNYPGVYSGVQIIINPKIDTCTDDLHFYNNIEQGVMISVHYQKQVMLTDFKAISPGTRAWLALTMTKYTFDFTEQPLRKLPCLKKPKLTFFDVEYSKENCLSDCLAQYHYKFTNCIFVGPIRPQYNICGPTEIGRFKQITERKQETEMLILEDCQKKCKFPCDDYWFVDSSISTTKFVSDNICSGSTTRSNFQNRSDLINQTLESLINLIAYFPTLDYNLVETKEKTPIFTFISNIGGQLSLWLGISIVTIVQLFFYICASICSK